MHQRPENYQGRRRATQPAGAHRAPAFARGAHAAPVSIQAGQTATAAVFGVTAAAVALSSAANGSESIEAQGETPHFDNASSQRDTKAAEAAAASEAAAERDAEVASRAAPRNDTVRAMTTAAPRVSAQAEKIVVKTAHASAAKRVREAKAKAVRVAAAKAVAARAARGHSHPMPGAAVTSCFGQRWGTLHAGIDFASPSGTPIRAVQSGTVVAAGWNYGGYGISVMLRHADGTLTHYAHMSKTAVKAGERVGTGGVLGYEGSTGDSTGPHLHFEVHKGMWNQVNPVGWLADRGVRVAC